MEIEGDESLTRITLPCCQPWPQQEGDQTLAIDVYPKQPPGILKQYLPWEELYSAFYCSTGISLMLKEVLT